MQRKINSKWVIDLNITAKTIKVEENKQKFLRHSKTEIIKNCPSFKKKKKATCSMKHIVERTKGSNS